MIDDKILLNIQKYDLQSINFEYEFYSFLAETMIVRCYVHCSFSGENSILATSVTTENALKNAIELLLKIKNIENNVKIHPPQIDKCDSGYYSQHLYDDIYLGWQKKKGVFYIVDMFRKQN